MRPTEFSPNFWPEKEKRWNGYAKDMVLGRSQFLLLGIIILVFHGAVAHFTLVLSANRKQAEEGEKTRDNILAT